MNSRTPLGAGGMRALQSERDKNRKLREQIYKLTHDNLVLQLLIKRGMPLRDATLFADTPNTQLEGRLND